MLRISDPAELQKLVQSKKQNNLTVGFVPTMGYLHEGHLSLVKQARQKDDFVVVSIFVNPTQFGPNEDYDNYPRNIKRDSALLKKENVDVLFEPTVDLMYPPGSNTTITVNVLQDKLCGKSRPGHFDGVTTIVAKLFNIVLPDHAYFGLKDFQQYLIITKMVKDLNFSVEVIGCPIFREEDGLAMSSRNAYLSEVQRAESRHIYIGICNCVEQIKKGIELDSVKKIYIKYIIDNIQKSRVDYIEILDSQTLESITSQTKNFLIATAVFVGKTRLIDNMIF